MWTDQAIFEVVDPETGREVPEGEEGLLVITPLFLNNAIPFLRWSSGDIVSLSHRTSLEGPFSVFPVMRHARRTVGFFKIRGVNVNHSDFEDWMFRQLQVNDFRVELVSREGLEVLRLLVEIRRGEDEADVVELLRNGVRETFETRPEVEVLTAGTLARDFEGSVKAPRFQDLRI